MTAPFSRVELEPSPRLYTLMARWSVYRRIYRLFLADLAAALPDGARLLDVGAGPGFLTDYLAALRPDLELCSLDLDHRMLHQGKEKISRLNPSPTVRVAARAEALPFPAASFNQVIATMSLHHWRRPDLGVAEILRVLKPGGRAWLYEMNRDATVRQLRGFAAQENLFFPLLFPVFRVLAWGHALGAGDFTRLFKETGVIRWRLHPAHHIFWRAELEA
ncbi:MAG: class I SAM-dependent methyltransferase [Deltaproteobacteria bacterium]|nr:MAG: class I SAM-dependent methyltransferase [Deltaproteobacteria bacterium]